MNRCLVALVLAVMTCLSTPVQAQSIRCNGESAAIGDSKLSVYYKCGQPLLADTFCAPVYVAGSRYPLDPAIAGAYVGCQQVEEWLYDRGPGNLMATVRFQGGRIQSIRYERVPD